MAEKENSISGFADIFLSKLKEQSFVIILMLAVIYYQHKMSVERVEFWQSQNEKQEEYIKQIEEKEREQLLERIKYLEEEKDKYLQETIDLLKNKNPQ
jgi:anion-transporting  ArsA/GET3 family ATPase